MSQNTYNEIPYETAVRLEMHPDRMAAVGRLFGMVPAPVERCRYLEIGCGDGNNVIAMAVSYTHLDVYKRQPLAVSH